MTPDELAKELEDLNFVPMGFETHEQIELIHRPVQFELCPYGIWNNYEHVTDIMEELFELCPYGIWN